MEIYLLRHGQTTRPGTFTGVTDVSLSRTGESQIRKISTLLKDARIEYCYCSPLIRCRATLELLNLDCQITYDAALKEIDFGLWEGLNYDQVQEQFPDEARCWAEQNEDFTFPRGANINIFNQRVQQWFDDLPNTGHNRVLIVAHGGVLRCGLATLLCTGSDTAFGMNFSEGAITRVTLHEGFPYLDCFNCRG